MKHLVAISAHKNPAHLCILVDQLLQMNMDVLIHLDKKTRSTLLPKLGSHQQYVIDTSIDVKRGHITIVDATLALMKEALQKEFDYFHLISGEDFVVKSEKEFADFFSQHQGKEFINHNLLPIEAKDEVSHPLANEFQHFRDQVPTSNYCFKFFKDGIGLVDTYHFAESSLPGKIIHRLTRFGTFVRLYHSLFKRTLPDKNFYAGSAWMSISKRAVDYFIDQTEKEPKLLRFMRNSSFPDEIYFQTLALASPFAPDIINSDLRYIDWANSTNFGPGILTEEDIKHIKQSSGFFARKFDLRNPAFLTKIQQQLL